MERVELTVEGVRTPVLRAGPIQDTETVVFVHGNPGSGSDWVDLIDPVASFARVLAPDMPGYGGADKPAQFDYTIAGYARHLAALFDAERVGRTHLVLHDFGGPWGLAWATEHVERVVSITLINIGVLPGYRWHYFARLWRRPIIGEWVMAATSRIGMSIALRHGNPRGLPRADIEQLYDNYDWGTRRAVLRLYRNTPDLGAAPGSCVGLVGSM